MRHRVQGSLGEPNRREGPGDVGEVESWRGRELEKYKENEEWERLSRADMSPILATQIGGPVHRRGSSLKYYSHL